MINAGVCVCACVRACVHACVCSRTCEYALSLYGQDFALYRYFKYY